MPTAKPFARRNSDLIFRTSKMVHPASAGFTFAYRHTTLIRMDKKTAKSLGLKKYSTGKLCKRGHISERWVSTGMCCECLKISAKEKYWEDPNKSRDKARKKYNPIYAAAYYAENKDSVLSNNKKWLDENKDRKKQIDAEYRKTQKEKIRAANAKWAFENPEKIRSKDRTRDARIKGSDGSHTAYDVLKILDAQSWSCVYCDTSLRQSYHVDHIMPISKGGSNWPNNLQCLCPSCNMRKGAKHPDEWHIEIGYEMS